MKIDEKIEKHWPRCPVPSIGVRKRDLIVRIADWTRDKDEPAYEVEVYVKGFYDWEESGSFATKSSQRTKAEAKALAIAFAQKQIETLLR